MPSLMLVGFLITVGLMLVVISRLVHVRIKVDTHVTVRDLREVSRLVDERVAEHLRAGYSGDPAQLPGVMRALLPEVRAIAAQHGQPLDDRVLRALLPAAFAAHHAGSRSRAAAALEEALQTERAAA